VARRFESCILSHADSLLCFSLSLTHTRCTYTERAGRLIYVLQSMYACVAKRLSKCRCTRSHTIIAAMRRESCVHESRIQQQRAHCACSSLRISSSPQVQNHRLRNAITLLSDLMSGAAFCALFLVVMHTNETMPHLHARFAQAAINLAIKLAAGVNIKHECFLRSKFGTVGNIFGFKIRIKQCLQKLCSVGNHV
jgi:hypothetical protein